MRASERGSISEAGVARVLRDEGVVTWFTRGSRLGGDPMLDVESS